jgi:hypothetical protein
MKASKSGIPVDASARAVHTVSRTCASNLLNLLVKEDSLGGDGAPAGEEIGGVFPDIINAYYLRNF